MQILTNSEIEITSQILYDPSAIKLNIDRKQIHSQHRNHQRLTNSLLNNEWVKEEIKKKTLKLNENENIAQKNFWDLLKPVL